MQRISTASCGEMISQVAATCRAVVPTVPPPGPVPAPSQPNYDGLAASIGALSVSLTWGAIIFAFLSLVIGFAWMRTVTREAKAEALEAAQKRINDWLKDEAPQFLREGRGMLRYENEDLNPDTPEVDKDAADKIAEAAG